jgi:2'-5' RNA ligase
MQTIRSFIAIPIPAVIQRAMAGVVGRIAGERDGMKWVPRDILHLTLKFLGEVDNREIPRVCQVVRGCCDGMGPFGLRFRGVNAFPQLDRPRVIYAGVVEGGEELAGLVGRLEQDLAALGFKPEPRDYVPHLTLGRTRGGSRRGSPELAERVQRCANLELGQMEVERVQLIASFLDNEGATYQVMDTLFL